MVRKILLPALLVLTSLALITGCGDFGKVEQGRVVAYDKEKKVVTFLQNKALSGTPQYVAPALVFATPADPGEMGKEPVGGMLRMNVDADKKTITMYNPNTNALEVINFDLVENLKDVSVRRQHEKVYDKQTGKAKKFPQVDADKKTVTIYSARQEMLTVMKFSDADFARYKGDEWGAGDEIRIYYKEPGKALRLMNVSQTNIMSRK